MNKNENLNIQSSKPQISKLTIILFVLTSIIVFLGGYYFYTYQYSHQRKHAEEQLITITNFKVTEFLNWRNERLGDGNLLFTNPSLSQEFIQLYKFNNIIAKQSFIKRIERYKHKYNYYDILVLDPKGNILFNLNSSYTFKIYEEIVLLDSAKVVKKPYFSNLFRSNDKINIFIDIVVPIFSDTQIILGYVIIRSNAQDYLFSLLNSWPISSKSSETLIIRRIKDSVLYLNNIRHRPNSALNFTIPLTRTELPAVRAVLGANAVFEGIDYRGVHVISYTRSIPFTDWYIVTKTDYDEAFSDFKVITALIFILIVFSILSISLLWFMFYNRSRKSFYQSLYLHEAEKNKTLTQLRENEKKMAELIDSAPYGAHLYYVNEKDELIFEGANKSAEIILNFSHDSLIGKNILEAFPALTNTDIPEKYLITAKNGEKFTFEQFIYDSDRITGVFEVHTVQTSPNHMAAFFRDVTERKKAEDKIIQLNEELEEKVKERTANLEYANKELESFSYSVSHDLRTPLRAIEGFTKILFEDYENLFDDEAKRLSKIIRTNTTKMGQLIDDLLSFSRLSRSQIAKSKVDVSKMINEIISEPHFDTSKHNFKLSHLEECFADEKTLRQVWINLISNAIKFSQQSDNPIIEIGSSVQNDEIIYYIKDNGVGFENIYADKLFGMFQRLHSVKEFEGTGVGLAIVQRIIEKHDGKLWANGELNKGATFYFSLPKIKE